MFEPVPIATESGEVIIAYRFTEADIADIGMASEMYQASPDGQEHYRRFLDSLEPGSITINLSGDIGE